MARKSVKMRRLAASAAPNLFQAAPNADAAPSPKSERNHNAHVLLRTRAGERNRFRPRRTRLPNPHPHPSRRHPQSPGRARPFGCRTNRHRQNRRLHAAQSGTAQTLCQQQHLSRHAPRADAGAHPHPRAGRPDRPQHAGLHQKPAIAPHRFVRRHRHGQADRRFAQRLRNRCGHGRAAA